MNFLSNKSTFLVLVLVLNSLIKSSDQAVYTCNVTASCGCSKNSATLSRIVGGETASSATWGWAVSLKIDNGYLCGGSIISDSWILTAAHCVNGYSASKVIVYAGSTTRWVGTQTRVASKIIVHSSYNTDTYENDIALVKLTTPLTMSDTAISKICLPSVSSATLAAGEWPAVGTTVVAVGWGTLTEGGSLPTTLQQVTLQTVSYKASTCSSSIADWHLQLCAGVSGGGKDTCQGDSGGPLMMFTSSNQWVLIGLTSYGEGCAQAAYSGVYTRVAAFVSWINTNTNSTTSTSSSTSTISTRSTTTTRSTSTTTRSTSTTTRSTSTTTRSTSSTTSKTTTRSTSTTKSSSTRRSDATTSIPLRSTSRATSTTRRRPFFWFF